jgi:nitrate/nitrite-specific signal transduction histidine kinase
VALGAGMWAIQPRYYQRYTYNVSMLAKELEKITKRKMFWLRCAGILFALGSVALAAFVVAIIWHA